MVAFVERVELAGYNGSRSEGDTFTKHARNVNGIQFAHRYRFRILLSAGSVAQYLNTSYAKVQRIGQFPITVI